MLTRPAATAVALLVAAPTAGPLTQPAAAAEEDKPAAVRGWSVDLDRRATERTGQLVKGRRAFSTVGVTWSRGGDPHVEVRTREDGAWSDWEEVHPLVGGRHAATEPMWVDTSRAVRVRVGGWRKDLAVVLINAGDNPEPEPEPAREDATPTRNARVLVPRRQLTAAQKRAAAHAPIPRLRLRRAWGANEKFRTSDPVYLDRLKQAHVHHTAGQNDYRRRDVPKIIRSIYWYHTKQLGWSDIGYNFLVDRFGRIWVGRAGGYRKRVRGAHTLGFNHASFGVASIGDHDERGLREPAKGALTRLIAWKLDREGRDPGGRVTIWSKGSDLFPTGKRLRLRVIDGHRDTNQTACPGKRLYEFLPRLRKRAQGRADAWGPA